MFPTLLSTYAEEISVPLSGILNNAFREEVWPDVWRQETVSVIPKCQRPESLGETRNISCTSVFSKTMEFFLLERLKKEAKVKNNQFGGLAGSSTSHYLAEAWTDIMRGLENDGGVTSLLSVDFAKAFNTVSHQACLNALKNKDVSDHCIRMTAAFLMERKMVFRAGQALSTPRTLKGGAPQGTLLGNYLFILATDQLEENKTQDITRPLPDTTRVRRLNEETIGSNPEQLMTPKRGGLLRPLNNTMNFSTPTTRGQFVDFVPPSEESEEDEGGDSFVFFNPCHRPIRRIDDSSPSDTTPTHEQFNEMYLNRLVGLMKMRRCISLWMIFWQQKHYGWDAVKFTYMRENSESVYAQKNLRPSLKG